jgi:cell division protein FtsW
LKQVLSNTRKVDLGLLLATFALVGVGVLIIYSSSGHFALQKNLPAGFYLQSHLKKVVVAFLFLLAGLTIDHKIYIRFGRPLFLFTIILMLGVLIGGVATHGATRWLRIGGFTFQPSEIMKISILIMLSIKLTEARHNMHDLVAGFVRPVILVGIVFGLLLLQPNYSMALMLTLTAASMLVAAGVRWKYLISLGLMSIPLLVALAIAAPYRVKRITAFLDPTANAGSSYQQTQSLLSLGNGGFSGAGLGESVQKLGYLPMPFTDTIYAILGEELGFLGTAFVLTLFGVLVWRGIHIASNANSHFGRLLALGLISSIFVNVVIHVGVCIRLLPTTGQPLPLISFGGTNLMVNLFALGVLLNISNKDMGIDADKMIEGGHA